MSFVTQPAFDLIPLRMPEFRRRSRSVVAPRLIDQFIAGSENALAAQCFSQNTIEHASEFSPIVFVGPSGSGKTSLAISLAESIASCRTQNEVEKSNVTITSATDFSRQLNHAIEADDMGHFRAVHRNCHVLVVDAVHELGTRPKAQEELVLTIDAMKRSGNIVIATSMRLPQLITDLSSRLHSRLTAGLSVPLQFPHKSTRLAILNQLADQLDSNIDPRGLVTLANNLPTETSAAQLRGILNKWMQQQRSEFGAASANDLLKVASDQAAARQPTLADIAKATARHFKLKLSDLRSPTRKSGIVRARGLAIYLMRQLTPASLESIGEYFGGRDHTTIMHAVKKTTGDISEDNELNRAADEIIDRVRRP